ncbi:MAG: YfiR family protein [Vicinamibacterales bacterium]
MSTLKTSRLIWRCALMVAVLLCRPAPATAQDVSVPSLKAAFLMNFVKFAEWPDGAVARGQVFTFCVAGDQKVFEEIALSIKRYSRPDLMTVVYVALDTPLPVCHMLYFGGSDLQAVRRVGESLHGAPVFTASDIRGFAEAGGIAELRLDKGKMRFSINAAAARRAHLALSAKLLSLATLVKETP